MPTVLVVDDDADLRRAIADALAAQGLAVRTAGRGKEALETVERETIDAVLLDLGLEDMDGLEVLDSIRESDPGLPVVILTGDTGVPSAVRAMRRGAVDYLTKPCRNEEISVVMEKALREGARDREVEVLRERVARDSPHEEMVGAGPAMAKVVDEASRIAPTDLTVILQGESGTGKELLARRIHALSGRSREPFVAVDCGALPESLVESELFGHEKGAFTGAHQRRLGHFELALGGTLFLDEVANLPYGVQAKFLRALQEKRIRRVGGKKDIACDARIVVASNVDLQDAVRKGRFREDLYHRLNHFTITLPPLRERLEDVEPLARRFLAEAGAALRKEPAGFSPEALTFLRVRPWPGNVRELKNAVTRAVLLADGPIEPRHLQPAQPAGGNRDQGTGMKETEPLPLIPPPSSFFPATPSRRRRVSLKRASGAIAAEAEKKMIAAALKEAGGNKVQAAKALGVSRMTLYLKLHRYRIRL